MAVSGKTKDYSIEDYFIPFISNLTWQTNRIQVSISGIKRQPFFLSLFLFSQDFLEDRIHYLSDLSSVLNGRFLYSLKVRIST